MRRIHIVCTDDSHPETWTETYTEGAQTSGFPLGHPDPEGWGRSLVDRFNNTLGENELPRRVISVELTTVPDEDVKLAHIWEKTNLVTIFKGGWTYDTARCSACGATAKRFGLGGYTLDPQFKKRESCPGIKPRIP